MCTLIEKHSHWKITFPQAYFSTSENLLWAWNTVSLHINLPLLLLDDLSDNAVAKASSSPGIVFFGEANKDSSWQKKEMPWIVHNFRPKTHIITLQTNLKVLRIWWLSKVPLKHDASINFDLKFTCKHNTLKFGTFFFVIWYINDRYWHF